MVVHRRKAFADCLRNYKIFIDGSQVGKIKNGETWSVEVPDGKHTLRLKIDWCGSEELTFDSAGEFECQANTGGHVPL